MEREYQILISITLKDGVNQLNIQSIGESSTSEKIGLLEIAKTKLISQAFQNAEIKEETK